MAFPQPIVLTAEEVAYYKEVCDGWESGEDMSETGLSRSDACDWAVYGLTVNGWTQLKLHYAEFLAREKECRITVEQLNNAAQSRYEVIQEGQDAMEELNQEQPKYFWQR